MPKELRDIIDLQKAWSNDFKNKDWATLERFEISKPGDSLGARREVFREIVDEEKKRNESSVISKNSFIQILWRILGFPTWDGEFARTERAVMTALWLVFFSIILMKIFQPRSIEIYFSDYLQGEWVKYKAGVFNKWMIREERACGKIESDAMSPGSFERWRRHILPRLMRDEQRVIREIQFENYINDLRESIADWDCEDSKMKSYIEKYELLSSELASKKSENEAATEKINKIKSEIKNGIDKIESWEKTKPTDPGMIKFIFEAKLNVAEKQADVSRDEQRLYPLRSEISRLEDQLLQKKPIIDAHLKRGSDLKSKLQDHLERARERLIKNANA